MNIKNFNIWLAALRSGRYRQGTRQLGGEHVGYCCLGVGCLVAEIPFTWTQPLPGPEFYEWLGLEMPKDVDGEPIRQADIGRYLENGVFLWAGVLNDDYNFTFAQIADWLEKHREELEVK